MTIRLSDGMRNSLLGALVTELETGRLVFYSGAQPANANAAPTGTVIAVIDISGDALTTPASGQVSKQGTSWEDLSADAAGTIGWARWKKDADGDGALSTEVRIDFSVTATGGGGDITVDNTVVAAGQKVTVTSFTITEPAS